MKNIKIIPFLALIAIFCSNCSSLKPFNPKEKIWQTVALPTYFKQEIPMYSAANHFYIKVNIGGEDYKFVIGTGKRGSYISGKVAAKLKLKTVLKERLENQEQLGEYIEVDSIKIGKVSFYNVLFELSSLQRIENHYCEDIDGFIGVNVLRNAVWQIDFHNNKIILADQQDSLFFASDKKTIPFTFAEGSNGVSPPIVTFNLAENRLCEAMFETAFCGEMTLSHKVMKSIADTSKHYSWYGMREEWNENIDTNKTLIAPNLRISKDFKVENALIGAYNRRIGLIGLGFMKDYTTTFDWKNKQIVLSGYIPNNDFDTFGYYVVFQDNKIIIYSLIQNSKAEQLGLRIFDHIVKINDQDVSNISLQDFCNLKSPYLQDSVKISVKRNNETLDFVLPKSDFRDLLR